MARPKSDDKRNAIMTAATRVIVKQGLGAATADIAKKAGVANGSLFTYFATKSELFNQLFLELKQGMAAACLEGLPQEAPLRQQFAQMWSNWMRWAISEPDQRRALALLGVSDQISSKTRAAAHQAMAEAARMLDRARTRGPLRDAPMPFVGAILNSLAEATMDFILGDPAHAEKHSKVGFDALWKMLGA